MSSFGEHLRRQREMRGISLDDIAATTKIGRRLLVALEEEQFDLLPGGIFNRSYVREYAKCVGLDEQEAIAEYMEAAQEAPPDTRVIAQQHASIHSDRRPERAGFPLVPVLVLLVVAAGGVAGWKVYQDRQRDREQETSRPPAPVTSSSGPVTSATVTTNDRAASQLPGQSSGSAPRLPGSSPGKAQATGATETSRPQQASAGVPAAVGTPFEIAVRPKDRAWVSIKADGNYEVRGIIKPPEVRTIHATNQVVFFTGNAGAVEVTFNGKNVPLTGGPNDEQVLIFDSRGLQPKAPAQ